MTLIAHYKLDEGPGDYPTTLVDSSGHPNSHNLTLQKPGTSISYGGMSPGGAYGTYCLRFSGSTGYGWAKSVLNPADLRLLGEMTCVAWVNVSGIWYQYENYPWVCMSGNNSDETLAHNALWSLCTWVTERLRVFWEYGAGVNVDVQSSANIIPMARWSHVGFRRVLHGAGPNFDVDFIVNGVLMETNTNGGAGWPAPAGGSSSDLALHSYGPTYAGCEGQSHLSDVRIWDEVKTMPDILAIYNATKGGFDMPAALLDVPYEYVGETFQYPAVEMDLPMEVLTESFQYTPQVLSKSPEMLEKTFQYTPNYAGTLGIGEKAGFSEQDE